MTTSYTEYEFTKRDGTKVYEICTCAADVQVFLKMHDAENAQPVTLIFEALQTRAQSIVDSFGSDRGFNAIEDYCDRLIDLTELEKRIANSENELSNSTPRRNIRFDQYIKVAADDISVLRKQDVYRVMDLACSKVGIAKYLKMHRPDLADEIDSVLHELTAVI